MHRKKGNNKCNSSAVSHQVAMDGSRLFVHYAVMHKYCNRRLSTLVHLFVCACACACAYMCVCVCLCTRVFIFSLYLFHFVHLIFPMQITQNENERYYTIPLQTNAPFHRNHIEWYKHLCMQLIFLDLFRCLRSGKWNWNDIWHSMIQFFNRALVLNAGFFDI